MTIIYRPGVSGLGWAPPARTRAKAGASGFQVPDEPAAPEPAPQPGISSLLCLQETAHVQNGPPIRGTEGQDSQARQHGEDLVAALGGLQRAMLGAASDSAAHARLTDLLARAPKPADPRLAAVLRAVTLRAEIEQARRDAGPMRGPTVARC